MLPDPGDDVGETARELVKTCNRVLEILAADPEKAVHGRDLRRALDVRHLAGELDVLLRFGLIQRAGRELFRLARAPHGRVLNLLREGPLSLSELERRSGIADVAPLVHMLARQGHVACQAGVVRLLPRPLEVLDGGRAREVVEQRRDAPRTFRIIEGALAQGGY